MRQSQQSFTNRQSLTCDLPAAVRKYAENEAAVANQNGDK
jgi:hypothetical protein